MTSNYPILIKVCHELQKPGIRSRLEPLRDIVKAVGVQCMGCEQIALFEENESVEFVRG